MGVFDHLKSKIKDRKQSEIAINLFLGKRILPLVFHVKNNHSKRNLIKQFLKYLVILKTCGCE
jgi:hypothetical protein